MVRWEAPPAAWLKLNFDGSVYNDGSGRASVGGAIRDCTGRVLVAFAEPTEHSTVGIVEARALIRGLRLALTRFRGRLVAEGDDLMLVQLLTGEETQTRIPMAMQKEILMLLGCFAACKVSTSSARATRSPTSCARRRMSGLGCGRAAFCRMPSGTRPKTTCTAWRTSDSARRRRYESISIRTVSGSCNSPNAYALTLDGALTTTPQGRPFHLHLDTTHPHPPPSYYSTMDHNKDNDAYGHNEGG
ncbi:hypothetical protein ZWY2020_022758 [Hordeum vulgare]|nr:hypothetical protein ZWY2020_022758 [Hordeum vulgare]